MPELPEVETVRRGLEPVMRGRTLASVDVLDARLTLPEPPHAIEQRLTGARVTSVGRRGKYLLLELDTGDTAIHHLRMTGSFTTASAGGELHAPHLRGRYELDDGMLVGYNDPRRFGTLHVFTSADAREYLDRRLGPEPFDPAWDPAALHAAARRRSAPIKAVLLDQKVVAGLGNIYVDEALFLAGIRPSRRADALTRPQSVRLHEAIVDRLTVAIAAQGSTLRDYRTVAGEAGGMQEQFHVYGRGGEPCARCGTVLTRTTIGGRGTVFCRRCQR